MEPFSVFSPSKINLMLAITGVRPDGFHNLVSLVAPLDWGDTLQVRASATGQDTLSCDFPGVPTDKTNLILKAAAALRKALPKENQSPFVHFILEKKTPAGAGLGGGSGNAAAALLALNRLCPEPQTHGFLEKVAGVVGSDCPLFIRGKPIVMRGRGEILEVLPMLAEQMITGRRVLIFKPSFGIPTAWAYGRMKEQAPRHYIVPEMADDILNGWLESPNPDFPLFNNMQGVAFEKYIALPALLNELKQTFKIPCLMSGSGSACFALPDENTDVAALRARVESAWGQGAWLADTVLR